VAVAAGAEASRAPDWARIDTVLLDLDGTLLDLAFDSRFWLEHVPERYGRTHGLSRQLAFETLTERMREVEGRLEWYCLDFWTRELGLDLRAMKHELRAGIRPLPGARRFLGQLRASGRRVELVTNAHPDVLALKMECTGLDAMFDAAWTSHDFGRAKEEEGFWDRLQATTGYRPGTSLFADDSLPVLAAARDHGIAELRAITRPDTSRPPRKVTGFPAIEGVAELTPIPPKA
jgi:putative hydrolase of the HAD superfamily